MDHYFEAQVHEDVLLARLSFRGTELGGVIEPICERYAIEHRWHAGFELEPREVPSNFRGLNLPPLAARIAVDGKVSAAVIGAAVRDLTRNPAAWSDGGSEAEVLLWHVWVRFGHTHR